jgi:predicted DNA-binding transcriptional regulator YafY
MGLLVMAGFWYMDAASAGKPPRTYRLSNILALTLTEQPFVRPKKFELAAYWAESTKRFESELYHGEAVLHLSEGGLKRLKNVSAAAVAEAAERSATPIDSPDGWVRVTVPIESIEHAADQMLRLGADAQVVEPAALKQRVRETVQRLAALYG